MKYLREYMNYKELRITYESNINYYFNYFCYLSCSERVVEIKIFQYRSIITIKNIIPIKILQFLKYFRGFSIN